VFAIAPLCRQVRPWEAVVPVIAYVLTLHARTGRPLGSTGFIKKIEQALGRTLHPQKPGTNQGVLGRILGFGSITVSGTGGMALKTPFTK